MLHILVGDSTGDPKTLFATVDANKAVTWMVPKTAKTGDDAVFYLPADGFVAYGTVAGDPEPTDRSGWYSAPVNQLSLLPTFVPLAFILANHPDWKWATYPRTYTTARDAIETRLRELLDGYQAPASASTSQHLEGSSSSVLVTVYERNPLARRQCIEHYGSSCFCCGFSFGETYGEAFSGYIHVHHITPVSTRGGKHRVDAIHDLRPVCPNCHAVIHSRTPPIEPSELKKLLKDAT